MLFLPQLLPPKSKTFNIPQNSIFVSFLSGSLGGGEAIVAKGHMNTKLLTFINKNKIKHKKNYSDTSQPLGEGRSSLEVE